MKKDTQIRKTYSGGVIPVDSALFKYNTPSMRDKYNKDFNWEANKEGKILQQEIKTQEWMLGCVLSEYERCHNTVMKVQDKLENYKRLLEAYKEAKKTNDFLLYVEEEQHGIRSQHSTVDKSLISDIVLIGYLNEKYGPQKALQVRKILSEQK